MIITKIIEHVLNIEAHLTSMDIDEVIMSKLKELYEGKCFKSVLILEIEKIIKRSSVRITQTMLDGSGSVDVVFSVKALIYRKGELIAGAKVTNINRTGRMICNIDKAVIHIKITPAIRSVKTGQLLPIRVIDVSYIPFTDKITISAVPYYASTSTDVYALKFNEVVESSIVADLIKEIKEFKPKNKKEFEFFKKLFRLSDKPFKNKEIQNVNLLNLATKSSKDEVCLVKHPIMDMAEPEVFMLSSAAINTLKKTTNLFSRTTFGSFKMVHEKKIDVLQKLLQDHLDYLKFLDENTKIYNTEALRKSHKNIWIIYERLKDRYA